MITYIDYNNIVEINILHKCENNHFYYSDEEQPWQFNRLIHEKGWYKNNYQDTYLGELSSEILKENLVIDNVLYYKPRVVLYTVVKHHIIYFDTFDQAREYAENLRITKHHIEIEE